LQQSLNPAQPDPPQRAQTTQLWRIRAIPVFTYGVITTSKGAARRNAPLSKQLHLKGGQARLPRRCLTISHRNRTIVGGVIKKKGNPLA